VLEFLSFALPAIVSTELELTPRIASGVSLTLGMVSDALKEIGDRKLPWSDRQAGGEAQ
jgi:hypothetical protein